MFYNPLEQFELYPLFLLRIGNVFFSLTQSPILLFGLGCLLISVQLARRGKHDWRKFSLQRKPNRYIPNHFLWVKYYHYLYSPCPWLEIIYLTVNSLLKDNVGFKGQIYFPFILTLFLFILAANLTGLVPYSFTITSHLSVTFGFALIIFFGVTQICFRRHGIKMLTLFLPSGTSLGLAFLLIPIEVVSYFFKPVSLGVRLFANMMAGHTLLKVIAGFAWTMMMSGGILGLAHWIPLIILIVLIGLELGVAIIQAYVFTILTCIYLNDGINLH